MTAAARRHPTFTLFGGCLVLAVLTLPLHTSLAFDPWAWLVWGREVLHLDLRTDGGPSWKPLPVLATTPFALFGNLAPTLWLVLARALGLLVVGLAFRLARGLAGTAAGLIAAVGLVLGPDGGPRFVRLVAEGHSAPAEAAFALLAAGSHLAGRRRATLAFLTLLSLLRPEAWPLLGIAAIASWREDRPLVIGLLVSVPLLWFVPDWWGSGSPLHGAGGAQVLDDPLPTRLAEALDHVVKVVVLPIWVGVAVALARARREDRRLWEVGLAALAWLAIVVLMAVGLRYAALSRFLLPAGAVLSVLGGVGLVQLCRRARPVTIAALVLLAVVFVTPRVVGLPGILDEVGERGAIEADLVDVVDAAGGRDVLLACGPVVADPADLPQAVLAWHLDVPLDDVDRRSPDGPHVAVVGNEGRMIRRLADAEVLATNGRWSVLAVHGFC